MEWIKTLGKAITGMDFGVFGAWARGVKNFFKSFKMESIGPDLNSSFTGFDFSGVRSGAAKVGSVFSNLFDTLRRVDYRSIGSDIMSSIVGGLKWTGGKLLDLSEWIGNALGDIDWAGLSETIGNGLAKAITGVKDVTTAALEGIGEFFTNIFSQIKWEDALEGLVTIKDKVRDAFQDINGSLFGKSKEVKDLSLIHI